MSRSAAEAIERALLAGAREHAAATDPFEPGALDRGLPGAARAWLEQALAAGERVSRVARLEMKGELRVGRWLPFRATEVLDPHRGFCWRARIGWGPIRLDGHDSYLDGEGQMNWRAYGLVPVATLAGDDVSRSNRERTRAEAVLVPGSLHPRWGVSFREVGPWDVEVEYPIDGIRTPMVLRIGPDGHLRRVTLRRWGAPDGGPFEERWFVVEIGSHRRFAGDLVPDAWEIHWTDDPETPGEVVLRGSIDAVEFA